LTLVRVLIAQGRDDQGSLYFDDALSLIDRLLADAESGARMGGVIEILILQALALKSRRDISEALAALERALTLAKPEGYVRLFVDEGAPMAALLSEFLKAKRQRSRETRHHGLLGYVQRLLEVFESPHTSTKPPVPNGFAWTPDQQLVDPLTAREREVLGLIAEGLSNQEIAAQLFIATSTVKGYVHSLFRKFEVDSRTRAVARARELNLISE
jgi:LuxR family maltose regulon positive regulatory protein